MVESFENQGWKRSAVARDETLPRIETFGDVLREWWHRKDGWYFRDRSYIELRGRYGKTISTDDHSPQTHPELYFNPETGDRDF
jgi:hypothetical protein